MQYTLYTLFDDFACCLHATDVPETYDVHCLRHIHRGFENFQQVRFQDHSKHGMPLPHPKFIAIHAAFAHVLHLSGAGKVMDKVYDRFFGKGRSSMPSGHISRNEDLAFRLALMELTPSNHQLPMVPHGGSGPEPQFEAELDRSPVQGSRNRGNRTIGRIIRLLAPYLAWNRLML